jgi:SAM-dependent methyltransferase
VTSSGIVEINRRFYDALWWKATLQRPTRFNTWPLVAELLAASPARLELGPGLRPRLPIAGTHFLDISTPVIEQLNKRGGIARRSALGVLPFKDREFDLVCAFDVIEHVEDDRLVFREISRVLKDHGVLLCSVPIDAALWTEFDDWVGHARRYDPGELMAILGDHDLTVEKSAVFGMAPSNPRWLKCGMWYLEHRRNWAMFWYNWVGMPLALAFQKRLALTSGLIDTTGVDEVLMVCRKGGRPAARAGA